MVLSLTQSARCSGDHLPGDTGSSLRSTHFVSDRFLLGIGVLRYAVREIQRGVQQRIGEDGGQVAPEAVGFHSVASGGTRCPTSIVIAHSRVLDVPQEIELACSRKRAFCTPWRSVQANPRLTAAFCWVSLCSSIRRIPSLRPSGDLRRFQRSADQTDQARQSLADALASLSAHGPGQWHYARQNHAIHSFGTGFRGCPAKYRHHEQPSEPSPPPYWSTLPSSDYRRWSRAIAHSSTGSKAVDQTDGGRTSFAPTRRQAACCTMSGSECAVLGTP